MSNPDQQTPPTSQEAAAERDPTRGAYESILTVALISFVGVAACIIAFGYWGENVVDGLENAAAEAMFASANQLREEGHTNLAIKRFRIALDGNFQNVETRYMCGRALGDMLRQEGRFDEAVEVYESLPKEAFSFAGAYAGYVDSLYAQGEKEKAAQQARVWLALAEEEDAAQQQEWAHAILFRVAQDRGDRAAALEHARAAVAANPLSDLGLPLARLLYETGAKAAAQEQLARFIAETENAKLRLEARAMQEAWAAQP